MAIGNIWSPTIVTLTSATAGMNSWKMTGARPAVELEVVGADQRVSRQTGWVAPKIL